MQYKYIVYDHSMAVCFCGGIKHTDLTCKGKVPTSAGFFKLEIVRGAHGEEIKVNAFGHSESLNLKSSSHDASLIALSLGIIR
jgi:hypothetical protein